MTQPKVYIVLVNYNRWEDTVECLESIFKLKYNNYSVIVVDNNSLNDSFDQLKDWANGFVAPNLNSGFYEKTTISNNIIKKPKFFLSFEWPIQVDYKEIFANANLIFIKSLQNLGFAGGNNIATDFALSQGDVNYIWYLNNDTVVDRFSLDNLIVFAQSKISDKANIGIIGTKLLYYDRPTIVQGLGGKYNKWLGLTSHILSDTEDSDLPSLFATNYIEVDYPIGASMLVTKDFITDVGLMSDDYFIYFEELDWSERARRKNWRIVSFLNCQIYHKESASIGNNKDLKNELSDYYNLRNRIIITKKFFKPFLPFVYFSFVPVIINRIKRKQYNRIKFILKLLFS